MKAIIIGLFGLLFSIIAVWFYKKREYQKWHKQIFGKEDETVSFWNMIRGK